MLRVFISRPCSCSGKEKPSFKVEHVEEDLKNWDEDGNWIGEPEIPIPESGEEDWYEDGSLYETEAWKATPDDAKVWDEGQEEWHAEEDEVASLCDVWHAFLVVVLTGRQIGQLKMKITAIGRGRRTFMQLCP